jgi:hypothetical protein
MPLWRKCKGLRHGQRRSQRPSPEIQEEVAKLAYQLWQERHGEGGSAEQDWLQAQAIVVMRLAAKITA